MRFNIVKPGNSIYSTLEIIIPVFKMGYTNLHEFNISVLLDEGIPRYILNSIFQYPYSSKSNQYLLNEIDQICRWCTKTDSVIKEELDNFYPQD